MDSPRSKDDLTAYPLSAKELKARLSNAFVDAEAFKQGLQHCSLSACHGMCCYDGVYVSQESASIISDLVKEESDFFRKIGLSLPEEVIVEGEWEGSKGLKTEVKQHQFSDELNDYPSHFSNTTCVFQIEDGRCGLQMLSEFKGLHPWYYKPFPCWLHPISVSSENKNPNITLYNRETDPNNLPNFDGYASQTHCGRVIECESPALRVLREELDYLGQIINRDLVNEIENKLIAKE